MKPFFSVLTALVLCLSLSLPTGATSQYRRGQIVVVDEPDTFLSDSVTYYVGDSRADASAMTWVEGGHSGKALRLSGNGEWLQLDSYAVRVAQFTFSGWVNWQGGDSGQRLFTAAHNTQNYLTFSPYLCNPDMATAEGYANGVYLGHKLGNNVEDMFNPSGGEPGYALPVGEWHHVAVTVNGRSICVYLDGVRWFEREVLTTVAELSAYSLDIGHGEWGDATLNALLDDVVLYNTALSAEEVAALAGQTASEPYQPTRPATTTTSTTTTAPAPSTTTAAEDAPGGVPRWGIYTAAGLVALYVVATVVLNRLSKKE